MLQAALETNLEKPRKKQPKEQPKKQQLGLQATLPWPSRLAGILRHPRQRTGIQKLTVIASEA